jgi:apolipoprotein N-acyltransferase
MNPSTSMPPKPLTIPAGLGWALVAVVSFHLAYLIAACPWCIVLFLYGVLRLAGLATARQAFWFGMAVGLAAYSYHLTFFWTLFGPAAIALWCVLSFWLGLFVLVGRACLIRFGPVVWAAAAPFLWTGLEYFRSELYYLRFSWLNAGYAFSKSAGLPFLAGFGVYGIGFLLMAWAAYASVVVRLFRVARVAAGVALALVSTLPFWLPAVGGAAVKPINVVGVQLEGASAGQVKAALEAALKKHPQTDLFVLSEYAFAGPVPQPILDWCKEHRQWLVAGGEKPISPAQYYNSVFVVGPDGAVDFQQTKCVPVQFMKDGLPAREQHIWNSPWGKLGFGICYDASYTRVTDELVRQGAQALIFPTMDNAEWGKAEHELHGRIAPMRAAEYAVPVFRLCSSGISQFAGRNGRVISSAPFPGQDALLCAEMELPPRGRMPLDRPLAELSVVAAAALILYLTVDALLSHRRPA